MLILVHTLIEFLANNFLTQITQMFAEFISHGKTKIDEALIFNS